jgi:tetrahydromethanopterin S-methyltransferase subunit A
MKVETIEAKKDRRMVKDPSGFFVIFLDKERREIVLEFYEGVVKDVKRKKTDTGKLRLVVCGTNSEALCHTIAREELVSRFEHAAYVGRELQKAETALKNGLEYTQDEDIIVKGKRKK